MDKILRRVETMAVGLSDMVDPVQVAQKVVAGLFPGVTTSQLDDLAAETAAGMALKHPDYMRLAGRVGTSNLAKNIEHRFGLGTFAEYADFCAAHLNPVTMEASPLLSDEVVAVAAANAETIEAALDHTRDWRLNFFGFKTLERSYLVRMAATSEIVERPQWMYMRVAIGIHGNDMERVLETYDLMSRGAFTHATPTLFNSGTRFSQFSSCFLVAMKEDSIRGIYETLMLCALISKYAGGIGIHVSNIRATSTLIAGTNGTSNGLIPMLRVFNETARYVDQGGGKRKGAVAVYLEPWHADVFDFLDMRKNTGKDQQRCRDLFPGLWIPDLFMKRVETNGKWTLMCPHKCPGLTDVYGAEFDALYTRYEAEGRGNKTVDAQDLWSAILTSQVETGTPYMLYKDAVNSKSNQANLGVIKSSNLCTEITEVSTADQTAVCNLGSVSLSACVVTRKDGTKTFDHTLLMKFTSVLARNLNIVIDKNFYAVPEAERSNLHARPMGIGVQGFADALVMLGLTYDSPEAAALNRSVFASMYYAAVHTSTIIAEEKGTVYPGYRVNGGCPASKGILSYDMWGVTDPETAGGLLDWAALKARVAEHGLINSLFISPMPTASTAQILGNNEAFEAFTSNMYTRRVLAGEFCVVNKHLVARLEALGMWSEDMAQAIIAGRGSVQAVPGMPEDIKALFRTVWEIKQRVVVDLAADRGPYVDQSMSLNIHLETPTHAKLTGLHFYGWKKGLKTGMYYLRSKAKSKAIAFTLDAGAVARLEAAASTAAASTAAAAGAGAGTEPSTSSDEADEAECDCCGA